MPVKPFYSGAELSVIKAPTTKLPQCGECGLYKGCHSPKMPYYGRGQRKILVVGEAPGKNEDERGRPFVGKAGDRLRTVLGNHGINLDRDCWTTNSIICRPPNNKIEDSNAVEYCRPNLLKTLEETQPEIILLTGWYPVASLIGHLWKEDIGDTVARWVGFQIPSQKINAWICPTYHPSYLERQEDITLDLLFDQHIRDMSRLQGRPWKKVPDYKSKVEIITDDRNAALAIRDLSRSDVAVAVDYETTTLKPDGPYAEIVCCSLSDGRRTIAFQWKGEAVQAMKEFWLSPVQKIAANLKMEDRWTRRKLGITPVNWAWDTVLAAHVIDNRSEITSVKFQSFLLLGQESYDEHIKEWLKPAKGNGGNQRNQIHKIGWKELLIYCGMDSLLEHKMAMIQADILGIDITQDGLFIREDRR